MGAIVLDTIKVNSYVLPNVDKSEKAMQEAYSTVQSLKNALPSTFSKRSMVNDIASQIYNIKKEINDVETIISKKVDRVNKIENKSDNKISGIASAVSKIGAVTGTIGGAAVGAASGGLVGAAVGGVVGNKVGKTVGKAIYKTGAKVVKYVTSGVKKIFTGIGNFFKKTASKIAKAVKSIWQKFSGAIKHIGSKVVEAAKKVGKAIYKTGAKVVNGVTKAAKSIWNGLKSAGKAIVNGCKKVAKGVKSIWQKFTGAVKNIGSKVVEATKKVGKAIYKAGAKVVNGVTKAAKSIWNGLKSAGKAIVNGCKKVAKGVKSIWQKFTGAIKNIGSKVVEATKKVGKAIYKAGAKVVNGVTKAAKSIWNGLKSAGKAIVNGCKKVAKGVKSIWQKFTGAIKNIGSKVVEATKKVGKAIYKAGAKVVKSVTSGVKKIGSAIAKGIKWTGTKISIGINITATWVGKAAKTTGSWLADKFKKVKDWTCKAIKDTGAWISKTAKSAWSWIKGAANTVWTHIKKIGASIANAVIAFAKGIVKLVEAIGDLVVLVGAGIGTIGTALYDVGRGICTGNWDWKATNGLWKGTKSVVAYDWTSKCIFDPLYESKFGKWLDANAYAPFKSDGIGCKILEGVGYVAGVVVLSIVTFGAAGVAFGASATVMGVTVNAGAVALTATAAGIGKYTQEEWNKNSLSIKYGDQELGLTIDYEKYCEIEKLKDGESTTITQQLTGADGKPYTEVFTITKSGDTYSVKDSKGNDLGFNGVKESSTAGGLLMGTIQGLGDGLKAYTAVSTVGNLQQFTSMAKSIGGGNTLQGLKTMTSNFGVKQSLKPLATNAAKNTFTDVGFYIDSGTHIYTDIQHGIKTGEWNLLKTGAKIVGAYGINYLGNLGGEYFSKGLNTSLTNIQTANQLDYNHKIGQQLDDIDNQLLKAEQLGDYDEIARLQQQKSLLNQEYYSTVYGADNVELTSGIGVEGRNGSVVDPNAAILSAKNITAKGGSYDRLDEVCEKFGITREDYLALTRTKQHNMTEAQRKLTFDIRKELTMDVTDASGVILPGTKISKSIDADTFAAYYKDGDAATLGGCIALERDTSVFGGNATEIIDSTGLRFDGSKFVDSAGNPNEFYLVEGTLSAGQSDVAIRVSATTDATTISPTVVDKFKTKYPDYQYNGHDIADVSSDNNTYLNEIWSRNSQNQVSSLSEVSGVAEKNIVTEQARWYNRGNNPDMGNGTTLNQGDSSAFGLPEFFAKERVGLDDGTIYRIVDGTKVKVAEIIGGIVCRV